MSSYVPLWCKSNFSFLEGASHPDELVEEAYRLGVSLIGVLPSIALILTRIPCEKVRRKLKRKSELPSRLPAASSG